ncbi:MAG: otsB [Polaromonas sp.]|nr:otsB [Polaromonas sp.]
MQTYPFAPASADVISPADTPRAGALPVLGPETALFLDFDGTLVDIASQPELVAVPAGLVDMLGRLSEALGGALAIVSGRALADIDRFLSPLTLPAGAEHGAVHRLQQDTVRHLAAPDLRDVQRVALALAQQHAGLRVEIKSAAVALHYRHAPELESVCLEAMAEAVKRTPGADLMHGKFVFEIKPAGVSKGSAIRAFMGQEPFTTRVPVFAGDDTTDEAGFAAVQDLGGHGIKVGTGPSAAAWRCSTPTVLREWLTAALKGHTT